MFDMTKQFRTTPGLIPGAFLKFFWFFLNFLLTNHQSGGNIINVNDRGQRPGKDHKMKFEIIDNRELDITGKGYKWTDEPKQFDREVLDDIRSTRGENYADCLSD